MPVTQARLPGFQSAKSARWYQALIGPIQATGSAGGFDFCFGIRCPVFLHFGTRQYRLCRSMPRLREQERGHERPYFL